MLKLKKITAVYLVIGLLFSILTVSADPVEEIPISSLSVSQIENICDYAENTVEEYYKKTLQNIEYTSANLEEYEREDVLPFSETLQEYILNKVNYLNSNSRALGYTKTYISGEYNVSDYEFIGNDLLIYVFADIEFRYSDSDSPDNSGKGEMNQLLVSNFANPEIKDWYGNNNSFDNMVRGYDINLAVAHNYLNAVQSASIENKIANAMEQRESANNYEKNLRLATSSSLSTNLSTNSQTAVSPWQTAIKNYSYNYAVSATPPAGASNVVWVNIDNGCTNFVSHALRYGGFSIKSGTAFTNQGWFCSSSSNRSTSWTSVDYLYDFINSNTSTQGPKADGIFSDISQINYTYVANNAEVGDIVQIRYNWANSYSNGTYGHSTIVNRISGTSIYINYRTDAFSHNRDVRLTDEYSISLNTVANSGGNIYRIINLADPG